MSILWFLAGCLFGGIVAGFLLKSPKARDEVNKLEATEDKVKAAIQNEVEKIETEFNVDTLRIEQVLINAGYIISQKGNIPYATRLVTSKGSIVNVFTSGRVVVQGTKDAELEKLFAK